MLTIDGSQGEGGGQILRTAWALSLVSGRPFTIEKIRARRQKPGLLRQHLTAVEAAQAYLTANVPVGEHLADQLLIPLALAGGGSFVTTTPTPHTRTNAEVIGLFLDIGVTFEPLSEQTCRVMVRASSPA